MPRLQHLRILLLRQMPPKACYKAEAIRAQTVQRYGMPQKSLLWLYLNKQEIYGPVFSIHKIRNRRRYAKPMLQQKVQADHASFCHPGKRMDMIKTKGQKRAAQHSNDAIFNFDIFKKFFPQSQFLLTNLFCYFSLSYLFEQQKDSSHDRACKDYYPLS